MHKRCGTVHVCVGVVRHSSLHLADMMQRTQALERRQPAFQRSNRFRLGHPPLASLRLKSIIRSPEPFAVLCQPLPALIDGMMSLNWHDEQRVKKFTARTTIRHTRVGFRFLPFVFFCLFCQPSSPSIRLQKRPFAHRRTRANRILHSKTCLFKQSCPTGGLTCAPSASVLLRWSDRIFRRSLGEFLILAMKI